MSQATNEHPFESQLRDIRPEAAIVAPLESSRAATEAVTEAIEASDDGQTGSAIDHRMDDNFDGIDWTRLREYCKPLRTLKNKKSWVYEYGYRVALLKDPSRTFWVCRVCYNNRWSRDKIVHEATLSTLGALKHMALNRPGHRRDRRGNVATSERAPGQQSLKFAVDGGLLLTQETANLVGNFNVQDFRYAAVSWLVDNNYPLREFETPAFKQMIAYANLEAAEALWVSHRSVSSYVMRLYRFMEPQVVDTLSRAVSKVHISFDG